MASPSPSRSGSSSSSCADEADLVSWLLGKLMADNARQKPAAGQLVFARQNRINLKLADFVTRVYCTMEPTDKVFGVALCLLLRLEKQTGSVLVAPHTAQLAFFACLVVATKFLQDRVCRMAFYAEVAAVPLEQLLGMERYVLRSLGFAVFVGDDELATTLEVVLQVRSEAQRRRSLFTLKRQNTGKKLERMLSDRSLPRCASQPAGDLGLV